MGASASLLEKVSPELQAEINAEVEKLKADGVSEDDIATQMKEKYAAQLATADSIACINIAYSCPDDKAEEVKAVFMEHAAWMEEFYKGDEGKAYLIRMHFSTGKQVEWSHHTFSIASRNLSLTFSLSSSSSSSSSCIFPVE